MKVLFSLLALVLTFQLTFAQSKADIEAYEKQYEFNIKQSRIDGVYIPKDVADAIREIKDLSPQDGLESYRDISDELEAAKKIHFGLGRWITVNWNFYDGSRLSHHLKDKGILHPDDMAKYLLVMLHRDLNNRSESDEALIKMLAEERKKIAESLIEKKTKL